MSQNVNLSFKCWYILTYHEVGWPSATPLPAWEVDLVVCGVRDFRGGGGWDFKTVTRNLPVLKKRPFWAKICGKLWAIRDSNRYSWKILIGGSDFGRGRDGLWANGSPGYMHNTQGTARTRKSIRHLQFVVINSTYNMCTFDFLNALVKLCQYIVIVTSLLCVCTKYGFLGV